MIAIGFDPPDHHTITTDPENVSSTIIRSHAAAVCGVNVHDAIGAKAYTVPIRDIVDDDTAVDASVQIVVNVQLVLINLNTADAVKLFAVPVALAKGTLRLNLKAGQY